MKSTESVIVSCATVGLAFERKSIITGNVFPTVDATGEIGGS